MDERDPSGDFSIMVHGKQVPGCMSLTSRAGGHGPGPARPGLAHLGWSLLVATLFGLPACRKAPSEAPSGAEPPVTAPSPADGPAAARGPAAETRPVAAAEDPAPTPSPEPATSTPPPAPSKPSPVVDRLLDGITGVTVARGGAAIAVTAGPRRLQVFDGSRGRLLFERLSRYDVVCEGRPITPDGARSLWLAPGESPGSVSLVLRSLTDDRELVRVPAPGGGRPQCAISLDGTAAVVASPAELRVYSLPSGAMIGEPIALTGLTRIHRLWTDERGAAVALLADEAPVGEVPARTTLLAWGGDGGAVVRRLRSVPEFHGAAMSPSGHQLAVEVEGAVELYSLWTGERVRAFPGRRWVFGFVNGDAALLTGTIESDTPGDVQLDAMELERVGLEKGDVEATWALQPASPESRSGRAAELRVTVSDDGQRLIVVRESESSVTVAQYGTTGEARFERNQLRRPISALSFVSGQATPPAERLRVQAGNLQYDADLETGDPLAPSRPEPLRTRVDISGGDVAVIAGEGGSRPRGSVLGGVRRPSAVRSAFLLREPMDTAGIADLLVIDDAGASLARLDGSDVPWPARLPDGTPHDPRAVVDATPLGGRSGLSLSFLQAGAPGQVCTLKASLSEARCEDIGTVTRASADRLIAASESGDSLLMTESGGAVAIDLQTLTVIGRFRTGPVVAAAILGAVAGVSGVTIAVSDGTDVTLHSGMGDVLARLFPMTDGLVVQSGDRSRGRLRAAEPFLRFQRDLDHLRDSSELTPLVLAYGREPVRLRAPFGSTSRAP
ncbi:MAG: hypothetical protein IV100_13655 [Myxococcales bacterium]|nr:hypothetical protein [Myxococcales bacterium]